MDVEWEDTLQKLDAKWETRFQNLEEKLSANLRFEEYLKAQTQQQAALIEKFNTTNTELLAVLLTKI
jgi:hypothetical protein